MIAIIDYGMGNLLSVQKAVEYLGEDAKLVSDPSEISAAERLVLPGVGAFPDAMVSLKRFGWIKVLEQEVLEKKKPFLGICLGMQLLAETGEENGHCQGLGWLRGEVRRFDFANKKLKVPHVGWNEIKLCTNTSVFKGLPFDSTFYFVHSYHMVCKDKEDIAATCNYGIEFTAAVHKENIFATQFHPEKSQDNGLKVLENFLVWEV